MTLLEQLKREREACSEEFERLVRPIQVENARTLRSASDIEAHFGQTDDCIQITPGIIRGSITSVGLRDGSVKAIALESSCGFQLRTEVDATRVLIGFVESDSGSKVIAHGCRIAPGDVVVVSGTTLLLAALGPVKALWLDLDVRRSAFALACENARSRPLCAVVRAALPIHSLLRTYLHRSLEGVPPAVGVGEVRAVGDLVSLAAARTTSLLHERRMRIFREAQSYMWAHIEEPATLEDICRAADCKVRTLIYAFKFAVGMSPMRYFKLQRLNAARRKLRTPGPATSILNIAADCGFWHMGHFGCDYKNLFGIPPSADQTRRLRRCTRGVIG